MDFNAYRKQTPSAHGIGAKFMPNLPLKNCPLGLSEALRLF
jgi:hypothetical protein